MAAFKIPHDPKSMEIHHVKKQLSNLYGRRYQAKKRNFFKAVESTLGFSFFEKNVENILTKKLA
jgi:hypothetical protein